MTALEKKPVSAAKVILAFAIVYIVWGSTYFFIRLSLVHFPPFLLGALRFLLAGFIMLAYCKATGERIFDWPVVRPALVSGLLLLFLGNGALIWSEQYLASSLAAILLAAGPIWFVLLDKRKWKENFSSKETIIGLIIGFIGVIVLFGEKLIQTFSSAGPAETAGSSAATGSTVTSSSALLASGATVTSGINWPVIAMIVLILGSISWAAGSLYSKYKSTGSSNSVNAGWQMLAAGIAFLPTSMLRGEFASFHFQEVSLSSWLSLFYLVTMGSLAGYSAFVWLLQVRSATQVSTHAYVNPVVAVLLGTLFANEHMSAFQLLGLAIILISVLLINLSKYRASLPKRKREKIAPEHSLSGDPLRKGVLR